MITLFFCKNLIIDNNSLNVNCALMYDDGKISISTKSGDGQMQSSKSWSITTQVDLSYLAIQYITSNDRKPSFIECEDIKSGKKFTGYGFIMSNYKIDGTGELTIS